jgi:taurine transport system permease protein
MQVLNALFSELVTVLVAIGKAVPFLFAYILLILGCYVIWTVVKRFVTPKSDFSALKTVTFGDESSVNSNFSASVVSIVLIFVLWGAFTGTSWLPRFMHVPGPFVGQTSFDYTLEAADGTQSTASVAVIVHEQGETPELPAIGAGDGLANSDAIAVQAYRSKLVLWDKNDEVTRKDGAKIVAINGTSVGVGGEVFVDDLRVAVTSKGTLNVEPAKGWQMEALYLPSPDEVWTRFMRTASEGYKNSSLLEHLGFSLFRVVVGFLIGAAVGIPLGYAMGLSDWFRGWFDPIVEFMRPVPPLALIPLVIIWAGIGEVGKIILLFLAALWIMAIAARAGVSGVKISKVHAAYSLGANKWQIMRYVIIPNSLPEIFTGARVAMGVCWGTVVAAELVAAEKGVGMMIMAASKFQQTDVVILGIILIGIIGFGIDMLIRWMERVLVPWKGRG